MAFNMYEQEKFHAQLSWAWKKFYNLEARLHVNTFDSGNLKQWYLKLTSWIKNSLDIHVFPNTYILCISIPAISIYWFTSK